MSSMLATMRCGARRQKTVKINAGRYDTGGRLGRNDGAGTGHRHYGEPGHAHLIHQHSAGIADAWRSGIGHERDRFTGLQPSNQPCCCLAFVVLMHSQQFLLNGEMRQQMCRMPRVLGRNGVHAAQNFQRTQRDILQISNRRGYHI